MKIGFRVFAALFCLLGLKLNAGNLKVNLAPTQAVSAGAQWRVDGGAWRSSGSTANGLSNANHTVDFNSVTGWIAPASATVAVVSGTTTLTGTYIQASALKITLTPASGQWRIDGGTWRASAATVAGLTPGSHSIDYASVSGYAVPSAETVALIAGQTTTLARNYTQLAQLRITLSPAAAQWRIDGGAWQASGATVANLAVGSHAVSYSAVSGYASPAGESVMLSSGQLLTLNRSYVQLAQVSIALTPVGAQWRVDGGAWQASGATVANLAVGAHTIDYSVLSGYSAPATESVSLASGQSLSLNRSYIQLAQVTVMLSPTTAQWRVDGGTWTTSGATWSNLAPGTHSISYSALTSWASPPDETVTLSAGQALSLARNYTQLAQILIGLVPNSGQWRANGGAWQASGTSLLVLPGTYVVEYSALTLYDSPASETLILNAGGIFNATRSYTSQKPSLRLNLGPAGQWRIDGGAWLDSGTQLTELNAGNHTLDYTDIGGIYDLLPSESITLALRDNLTLSRSYPFKSSSLQVNLTPGIGTWRAYQNEYSSGWQPSGATITGLRYASYNIEYSAVANYLAPPVENVGISPAQSLTIDRSYTALASLNVALTPSFAQWRLDGGPWQSVSTTLNGLALGAHTIDYSAVGGYITPASETVTLVSGLNPTLSRTYVPLASFHVDLNPSSAQWRLDGGPWQFTSATLNNLSLGNHLVDFAPYEGYITPPSETVALTSGLNPTLSRTYVQLASFHVDLNPTFTQWRLDGGPWQFTSATLNNLSLGDHTVDYAPYEGFIAPPSETVTLVSGLNPTLSRTYTPLASLHVDLNPTFTQWRLDGGPWQFTSVTLNNLSLGDHTVDYAPYEGFIAPPSETVTLVSGLNPTLSRTYVPLASFHVDLNPTFTQWRLDGGPWQFTSVTLNNLSLGDHTVDYAPYEGFIAPPSETVTLVSGLNPTLSRTYTPLASLHVDLNPTFTQWRLDGGPWQFTSATLNNLSLGDHTVDYAPYEGFIAPPSETVTLVSGLNPTLSRTYVPVNAASLTIALAPSSGSWRVDGGMWQASGALVINLTPGSHAIDFSAVPGYIAPPPQTLILEPNGSASYTFTYTPDTPIYTVIKNFFDAGSNATIVAGRDGAFYGFSNAEGGYGCGVLFRINADGSGFTLLKTLGGGSNDGNAPTALLDGSDGALYGTTNNGGSANTGTVFKVNKDGTGYTTLRIFVTTSMGINPNSLIEGSDGLLYGTTTKGGVQNEGLIFKMGKDGSGFTTMKHFSGGADGKTVVGLVEGPGGLLYGTTAAGGAGFGVVFRLNNQGGAFTVLKTFAGGADGATPRAALLAASDGLLYGSTLTGGASNRGTLFCLNSDGTGFTILKNFAGTATESGAPTGQLQEDPTGVLYGIATTLGPGGRGSVFKINKDGSGFAVVKTFTGGAADGGFVATQNAPIAVANGVIHGATRSGGAGNHGVVFAVNSDGSGFAPQKSLGAPDGSLLMTPLTEGRDGVLYGESYIGGSLDAGAIFKVNKDGSGFAVLRNLAASGDANFNQGVVEASDGALYGIAAGGLFRLNKDGTGYTVVRSFVAEASSPTSVIEGSNGVLYGTTGAGAANGFGGIFKINRDGSGYTILHNFLGNLADGKFPSSTLLEGRNGLLYGVTSAGGSSGSGTVFAVNKDGTGYVVIKHFTGGADGAVPYGTVVQGSDNLLYGTTTGGGSSNQGVIFKMAVDGSNYLVLQNFTMPSPTSQNLTYAGVVEKNGALYGVTYYGGTLNGGTVFRLQTDGSGYTTLINFGAGDTDGTVPAASLTVATDGNLYGTTGRGGSGATIYRLRGN